LSRITCIVLAITFDTHLSISMTFRCASTIPCISMDYCTSTYTFVDECTFASTTFSSPTSIYTVYASTKCCSIASSSFDSSMNTRSTYVIPSCVCFLACQLPLLLRKKLNYRCSIYIYIMNLFV
jgi:hypothetical protein